MLRSAEPQIVVVRAGKALGYPFLAQPPPQKKRPTRPLPSPPLKAAVVRSPTYASIATWAAHVQPGSPASLSPRSPRSPPCRRPSFGRHRRRSSVASVRTTSRSFSNVVPTPSVTDFKPDLISVGYTSVFLQFPDTPASAVPAVLPSIPRAGTSPAAPVIRPSARNPRVLHNLRSLATLRTRVKARPASPSSPTKMKAKSAAAVAASMRRKRAKYPARPPPLANELALMQFADGGSIDHNAQRLMQEQAKATGSTGVGDVYRDEKGGIWMDQDEEWEYAHLLAHIADTAAVDSAGELHWVTFDGRSSPSVGQNGEERRGSLSTQDSDLDPRYVVQPVDLFETDDVLLFGSAFAPVVSRKPAMSILALPSRPRRAAKHLHKADYLVDAAFPRVPSSPRSPKTPRSAKFGSPPFMGRGAGGRTRKRPAPLKLVPPGPALKKPTNSPVEAERRSRREFLSDSFAPVRPMSRTRTQGIPVRGKLTPRMTNLVESSESTLSLPMKKASMLNMMALFKSPRKEDVQRSAH